MTGNYRRAIGGRSFYLQTDRAVRLRFAHVAQHDPYLHRIRFSQRQGGVFALEKNTVGVNRIIGLANPKHDQRRIAQQNELVDIGNIVRIGRVSGNPVAHFLQNLADGFTEGLLLR